MAAPTLDETPGEVYAMIVELLRDRRDVNSLCQTSKKMYEKTVSYLYESISLYAPENDLGNIDISKVSAARRKGLFRHSRNIKVWSHFYRKTSNRCMHMTDGNDDCHGSERKEIAGELECLLRTCETGKIRSFDWSMGTCVPHSLLGLTGLLTLNQQNIESIRLVTDGLCRWNEQSGHRLALCTFPNLKHLSWTGLSSKGEFDSLADVLDQVSNQLEELEIDLTYHQDWCDRRDFGSDDERTNVQSIVKILGLSTPSSSKFPVLKRLALTAVPFPAPENDSHISGSFGFSSLQSLKLKNCDGWQYFIRRLTDHAEPLQLRSLELQLTINAQRTSAHQKETLVNFLRMTQGLDELFLLTNDQDRMYLIELWDTVLHHRASLRRFVHHIADIELDTESETFGRPCDLPDLGLDNLRSSTLFPEIHFTALQCIGRLDLISLGLCCYPDIMQRLVSNFASKKPLQVLHLRQSGKDLRYYPYWANTDEDDEEIIHLEFVGTPEERLHMLGVPFKNLAQWAFGPNGISSLRLLAYGDFSGNGRFQRSNLLLCRRGPDDNSQHFRLRDPGDHSQHFRFREVRPGEDTELWELYEREKQVLEACPRDSLLRLNNER